MAHIKREIFPNLKENEFLRFEGLGTSLKHLEELSLKIKIQAFGGGFKHFAVNYHFVCLFSLP